MWEDERNRQGGRWLVNTSKNVREQDLDRLWLETVRMCTLPDLPLPVLSKINHNRAQFMHASINKIDFYFYWEGADKNNDILIDTQGFPLLSPLPPKKATCCPAVWVTVKCKMHLIK